MVSRHTGSARSTGSVTLLGAPQQDVLDPVLKPGDDTDLNASVPAARMAGGARTALGQRGTAPLRPLRQHQVVGGGEPDAEQRREPLTSR